MSNIDEVIDNDYTPLELYDKSRLWLTKILFRLVADMKMHEAEAIGIALGALRIEGVAAAVADLEPTWGCTNA